MHIKSKIFTPDEFIALTETESLKWINYCEIVIYPDGNIELARPSHTETLFRYYENKYHLSRAEINREIPEWCSPLHYIIEKENLVSVWYEFVICSEAITAEQERTLEILKEYKLIKTGYIKDYSHEYSLALERENI